MHYFKISFAATLTAIVSSALTAQLPNSVLDKREDITPGSPLYNCHEACGEVILISQSDDYCDNSTFTSDLESCLECALTYNIWKYYGSEVKSAAKECNDDATPSASSASSAIAATATAIGKNSSTTAVVTTGTSANVIASATGTASSSGVTTGAASSIQQNTILPIIMGGLTWALLA
ncbi:hypothetical protein N7462_002623 [Penicillium macrosclerotiorum]|uniref:uncharacterized protein n=1 Tax=Penicillium macrosclerotiorum TaxID=303699 RepID=UPI002549244A|nr:uncharacterized protein N7462_002623 [Penicillium macrosclerotiorum]KAJ5693200.1 hypothetical protein N7462_002623 [Penicillium macrosclerotiorum]